MKRLSVILLAAVLFLGGCNLAGDVTPPPDLSLPAVDPSTPALTVQPTEPGADTNTEVPVDLLPPASPPDLANGEAIYLEKCAPCHGEQGMGDGDMAGNLEVPIPELGDPDLARPAVPLEWYEIITMGRMENFMPPFQSLSDEERWDVTVYALNLSVSEEEFSLGEETYAASCIECHGEDGASSVSGVDLSDPSLASQRSAVDAFEIISEGRNSMPPFSDRLTEEEIWAVSAFTRDLAFPRPDAPTAGTEDDAGHRLVTITGTVFNGTSGAETPENLEVMLVGFDGDQPAVTETALLDAEGAFTFEGLEFVPGRFYGAIVDYDGVRYFSSAVHALEDEMSIVLPLVVHETTQEVEGLVVERLHVIFDFSIEGLMDVTQIWLVTNQGDRTFLPDGAGLVIPLPEGIENLQASDTTGLSQLAASPEGVEVIGPLRAGETSELAITFSLPYKRSARIIQEMPLPVSGATVITAEDAPEVRAEGLVDQGLRDMGGPQFHSYELEGFAAGEELSLEVSGAHPATTPLDTSTLLLLGAAILGVAMVGTGIYLWRTQGRDEDLEEEVPESPDSDDKRVALIQTIADLDDEFQAGKIDEDEYQSKREKMKQELKEILSKDD